MLVSNVVFTLRKNRWILESREELVGGLGAGRITAGKAFAPTICKREMPLGSRLRSYLEPDFKPGPAPGSRPVEVGARETAGERP